METLIRAFLLAALLAASQAQALDLEAAVGQSQYCCLTDGVWWQSSFGFTGNTRPIAWEAGVRQRFGNWGIAARYAELGTATGHNIATMRDDDVGRYNPAQPCDQATQHNCLGKFDVSQRVAAVMLGASYRFTLYGVALEPELGQALYQSHMRVAITCQECGAASKYAFGEGGTFSSRSEIRRSPYLALRVIYKGATLTYRRLTSVNGDGAGLDGIEAQFATGLTHGPVNQILLGVEI